MRPLSTRLLTEFVGTFAFLAVIALSGGAGALAPVAVGLALAAMVYMGGHVSGANYNPAVSLALFLRGVLSPAALVAYWAAQLLAGAAAFGFALAISGRTPGIHPGSGVSWEAAIAAEAVFTTALALVVLNVAATRETAGNSYYGLAIGFTVAAGAFAVGPVSGAALNPAVAFGATLVASVSGRGGWSDLWIYVVAPLAGAALAAGIHALQARPGPVPAETSER
jgi:aquaporin Z